MDYLPHIAIGAVFLYLAYRVLSKGGIKAALFGSGIAKTIGEIELSSRSLQKDTLRVHKLADGNTGIERTMKAPFGFSTTTITLTRTQAEALRDLLKQG